MNAIINIILIIAIAGVLLTQFVFNPETNSVLNKINNIAFNLSYSYIIAYIFYAVVSIPEKRKKKIVHEHLISTSDLIVGRVESMLSELAKASGMLASDDQAIRQMCTAINPHAKAPLINGSTIDPTTRQLVFSYANWAEYIIYYKNDIKKYIDEIIKLSAITDAVLLDKVLKIQKSVFFIIVDAFLGRINSVGNQDLSAMEDQFKEIRNLAKELKIYNLEMRSKLSIKKKS